MSALAIDLQSGDFLLTQNQLTLVDGEQETLQLLYQTLWSFQGEWFMNLTSGIPYLQKIFIKNPVEAEAILKAAVAAVPGLTELQSLTLTVDPLSRDAILTVEATAQSGQVLTAQVLLPGGAT